MTRTERTKAQQKLRAFISDLSPRHLRGRYQGIFGAVAGIGAAAGPPLGGLALDTLPDPLPWLATAVCAVLAAVGLLWLASGMRDQASHDPAVPD